VTSLDWMILAFVALLALPRLRRGLFGALFAVAVGLGLVWLLAAAVVRLPAGAFLRPYIQHSAIIRRLDEALPPPGPILGAIARLDPLPSLPGPLPALAPPPPRIASDPGVLAASRSVVRVLGTACGLAVEGSGWAAGPELVVTNAHVVAGESDTTVERSGRPPELPAHAVAFDPTVDLAVLRVPGLSLPALTLRTEPPAGEAGAILGYPENGPFDVESARIGPTGPVVTQDAYGHGPLSRLLTPLRGLVRPGNSGGPVVDASGLVLTTLFAGTTGSGPRGGYGVANASVARILRSAGAPVGTGPCDGQ
jgi:S1-C subfamily serine protease